MIGRRPARAALLATLMGSALSCSGGGSSHLQGRWKGQRAEGVAPAALAAANTFAASMILEIKGDAITVTTGKDKQAGHYKVVKEDKTTVVITTDKDGPTEPQTFAVLDDKTLKWTVVDGESIVFVRQ